MTKNVIFAQNRREKCDILHKIVGKNVICMNIRQKLKHKRVFRDIRYICYNYFCGMCEYRKIRPKAIWDFQRLERKRLYIRNGVELKIGDTKYVPVWMKRGYKILQIQHWNGKWWVNGR